MNISDVVLSVRGNLKPKDFVPVSKIKNSQYKIALEKELGLCSPILNYKDFVNISEVLDVSIDKLFIITNAGFDIYCYLDMVSGTYVSLYNGSLGIISNFDTKRLIEAQTRALNDRLADNNYSAFFRLIDSKLKLIMLNLKFKDIPDKDKYDIFTNVYCSMDYDFCDIESSTYKKVKELKPTSVNNALEGLENNNGNLTIYRGVAKLSSDLDKAYSWTICLDTAKFFANRFNCQEPIIYSAEVNKKNVIAYITDRDEVEIVVDPQDVIKPNIISI